MTDMAILLMPCVKAPPEQVHLHLSARADTISARGSVSDTGTKGRRRAEPTGGGGRVDVPELAAGSTPACLQ